MRNFEGHSVHIKDGVKGHEFEPRSQLSLSRGAKAVQCAVITEMVANQNKAIDIRNNCENVTRRNKSVRNDTCPAGDENARRDEGVK